MNNQTHGFYQETHRGFTITSEHEGADGEITGYTVAVDSPEASEATGEDIGSVAPGPYRTIAAARRLDDEWHDIPRWRYVPGVVNHTEDSDTKCGAILDEYGWYVAAIERNCPEPEAHAERIVACVNGCAGIADPSAVGDVLEAMKALRTQLYQHDYDIDDQRVLALAEAALAKAEGR